MIAVNYRMIRCPTDHQKNKLIDNEKAGYQLGEGRSLCRVFVPAVEHHVVDLPVAVLRLLGAISLFYSLHHLVFVFLIMMVICKIELDKANNNTKKYHRWVAHGNKISLQSDVRADK